MRVYLLCSILLINLFFSCTSEHFKGSCNENKMFKYKFQECIGVIERYRIQTGNKDISLDVFKEKLKLLSYHVDVDYSLLTNYEFRYTSKEIFDGEKCKLWYEKNKCQNLQWSCNTQDVLE